MSDRELLEHSVKLIRLWHGMGMSPAGERQAWEIYWKRSPEMKPLREALGEGYKSA